MKRAIKILSITSLGLVGVCIVSSIVLSRMGGRLSFTLPVKHKEEFADDSISEFPSQLQSYGNQIVDANGKTILLRGLMPPDPARLRLDGEFDQTFFGDMASTGANVIRIPVHPESWVHDPDYLWRYLDPIVRWAGTSKMYVIIDWHFIGNILSGAGPQMPDLDANPRDLTLAFWQMTARYFRNTPNVIFEIVNEPQSIGAGEWRGMATEIVQVIRAQRAEQLVIVGGIDYGKDLSWVLEAPVEAKNIAYASHIYPAHPSTGWEHWFGAVAGKYPVVITEWGFMDQSTDSAQSYLVGTQAGYGEPFLNDLDERGIGWVACWYDDEWFPPMFTQGRHSYTGYGDFVIQRLKQAK